MAEHVLIVLADATPGGDAEFNEWYSHRHLDDVLALEGIVAAQRFVLTETPRPQRASHRYLAIYEIAADQLGAARRALAAAQQRPDLMPISATLADGFAAWWYAALGERRVAETLDAGDPHE